MRYGPTSLQVSSILSKGLRRPKLRSDLRIAEQIVGGETSFVIKVAETNSYHRYGTSEYELLTLCDGTRTPKEIAAEFNLRHPEEVLQEVETLEFLDGIDPAMWERSLGEKNLAVLARIRDERKSRVDQSNVLYMSFKAWDPDKVLTKLDPYLGWMFTPGFVVFSILLFITTLYLVAGDWNHVQTDTQAFYSFKGKTAYDIWVFWFLLMAIGAIHEFGHGLTCKHFGGEVHQMGFLLIYFTPAFYTDTTDILLFDRTSRRQWVIFAGMWIELVVCGLSTLLWHFSVPGTFVNDLAYKAMLLSGIEGTLFNLDPLIKADGYYALSQYLGVDNLREDSFAYVRAWARRNLLFEDIELPTASRRHRRIYLIYGIIALIYSVGMLVLSIFFLRNVLVDKLGSWGYPATFIVALLILRRTLRKGFANISAWFVSNKEAYMAWKSTRTQQAGAIAVLLLLFIPPIPSRFSSDLVLEPQQTIKVRPAVSGMVRQVEVHPGDMVSDGQVLAELGNPELQTQERILTQQLTLAESSFRDAQSRSDRETVSGPGGERQRLRRELEIAQEKVDGLQIRAPLAGILKTPDIQQRVGEFLSAGDQFCEIVNRSAMKARILVRDSDLEQVHLGAPVTFKVQPFPFRTYSGRVEQILPAASADRPITETQRMVRLGQDLTNHFVVLLVFPNSDGSLLEGMTGTAKISGQSTPVGLRVGRALWRWMHSQIW
jgi:putative peptide zinc metalloprotease protein